MKTKNSEALFKSNLSYRKLWEVGQGELLCSEMDKTLGIDNLSIYRKMKKSLMKKNNNSQILSPAG